VAKKERLGIARVKLVTVKNSTIVIAGSNRNWMLVPPPQRHRHLIFV